MRREVILDNQEGVAATEFIVVSFVFLVVFAGFVMISDTILFKMKSLIKARSLAFNVADQDEGGFFRREVIPAFETPAMILDKCLSPDLAGRPSRIKTQVEFEVPGIFKEFISVPEITDQYLVARDTWKGLSPTVIGTLIAACPG